MARIELIINEPDEDIDLELRITSPSVEDGIVAIVKAALATLDEEVTTIVIGELLALIPDAAVEAEVIVATTSSGDNGHYPTVD